MDLQMRNSGVERSVDIFLKSIISYIITVTGFVMINVLSLPDLI